VLLVSAALLVDSFRRLQKVDPGFRAEDISTFVLGLPPGQYPTIDRQAQFFQQALEKIGALPGVTHAAATNGLPIVGGGTRSPASADGAGLVPMQERAIVRRGVSTPGFFAALDIPIRQGRDFTWRDNSSAPNVVVINEVLAKRLFPDQDPIGRRIITGIQSIPREVVGVFANLRSENLSQAAAEEMFYPAMQVDGAFLTIIVRSPRPAGSLRPELVNAIHALDPGLPVAEVHPFTVQLAGAVADRRLAMTLLGGFAVLALVLAGMGIYSVIAYSVAQRTNEFGIRMALGAAPGAVVGMVMKEGLRLAGLGLLIGLLLSIGLTRLMQQQLFEVSATDPLILGGVAAFLCAIAALACFVPARRATQVDPMTALRSE
jgi:predicted permease